MISAEGPLPPAVIDLVLRENDDPKQLSRRRQSSRACKLPTSYYQVAILLQLVWSRCHINERLLQEAD